MASEKPKRRSIEEFRKVYGGTPDGVFLKGANIAGQNCDLFHTSSGGFAIQTKDEPFTHRQLEKFVRMHCGLADAIPHSANDNGPVDVWRQLAPLNCRLICFLAL